jgi:23S rRNA pseudouridine1911/1915/1917 synthase
MRLDAAVALRWSLGRRAARDAVRAGRVDVDGAACDEPGREVPGDSALSLHPNRPARHRVQTRLSVLFEDEDLLVVDKPAGLLTVPTAARERDTLLAQVLDYLHRRYARRPVAFVVHRIDRDTSGAVVFARNRESLRFLQDLFRAHRIEREYVALVEGALSGFGVFDADLVRDAGERRRGVARRGQEGRRAVTRYRTVERVGPATLVSIELETGRTHQIRVHFAAAGHPVLGDPVYRPRGSPTPPIAAPRQMLHARRLGFVHPQTGRVVRSESPVPADFAAVLKALRSRQSTVDSRQLKGRKRSGEKTRPVLDNRQVQKRKRPGRKPGP